VEGKCRAFVKQLKGDLTQRERESKMTECSSFDNDKKYLLLELSVSVEIFNFHSGQINLDGVYPFSPTCTLRKTRRTLIGANTSYNTGTSTNQLVAKGENVFKILIIRTFSKTVKLTDSQIGTNS